MRTTRGDELHKFTAPEAHRPAEHTVEGDGNDRRVHIFHDVFDAAPERQQLADARDLALGKNADDFTIADGIARLFQSGEQFAWPLFGRDRNGFPDFGEWFHPPFFVDTLEHQKADGPVGRGDEQQCVGEGNVVADEERAAFFRNVIAANDADAVNAMRDAPQAESQERVRHQQQNVNCAN